MTLKPMPSPMPPIAEVVFGLPIAGPFDYAVNENAADKIKIGHRVRVSFNHKIRTGFVVGLKSKSRFSRLNPVLALMDDHPALTANLLKLAQAMSAYYGCSLGEAIEASIPVLWRKDKFLEHAQRTQEDQASTKKAGSTPLIIHDRGGRKRWSILLDEIDQTLIDCRSVLFLIPEMSALKSIQEQILSHERFIKHRCPVYILDKKSPQQEINQWNSIRASRPSLVLGLRSAVFAPSLNLGLLIIYEEDNDSFREEQAPYYHVSQVAAMRQKLEGAKRVFVSTSPSAELWYQAKKERWTKMILDPDVQCMIQLIDMTNYNPMKTSILSFPLQEAIRRTMEAGEKTLLFLNRRGFNTFVRCPQCHHTLTCHRCNTHLVYMVAVKMLVCRQCNFKTERLEKCPACTTAALRYFGMGDERLEAEVARYFPQARVLRYDKDTPHFRTQVDLVIATQAIFNVPEKPAFALLAVLDFDAELSRIDFRSSDKAFSLLCHLSQLCRNQLFVQTRMMEHYCLKAVRKLDFEKFYAQEIKLRREIGFPPFKHFMALGIRGPQETQVVETSKEIYTRLEQEKNAELDVSDPHPDIRPKLRDKYRYTVMLKDRSVKHMLTIAKKAFKTLKRKNGVQVTVQVDP